MTIRDPKWLERNSGVRGEKERVGGEATSYGVRGGRLRETIAGDNL
jgi:hypothetical protein